VFNQQLTPEQVQQMIDILRWIVFAAVIGVAFYAQYKTNKHVVVSFTQALDNLQRNPVALENAKAAGAGVPQEAYVKLYGMLDGLIGILSGNTEITGLLKEIKETAEAIDRDPTNDPPPKPSVVSPGLLPGSSQPPDNSASDPVSSK
jgi:hypothetical protein